MRYAEVSVNSPVAQRRTFSYAIPDGLDVRAGQAVLVPFGEKVLQGVVMELTPLPAVEDTRDVLGIIESVSPLSSHQISLARWISDYYLAPLFSCVALMLPPSFERKALPFLQIARQDIDTTSLDDKQRKTLDIISTKDRVEQKVIEKALGKKKAAALVSQMVKQGLLSRSYELSPIRVKPKTELYISLVSNKDTPARLTAKRQKLYDFLKEQPGALAWAEVRRQTGVDKATANVLEKLGLITWQTVEVKRSPLSDVNINLSLPLDLTPDQQTAFASVKAALDKSDKASQVFLLHGVTGSGKTEIYLQSLAEALKQGKRGIVLVPEISLTPQTIERFASRFPGRVGVLHSRLSPGEQFDEWHRIQNGECDVVIGSRSALFAPQPDLGLIVIDEEHEWTYKQDSPPHYHTSNAAIKMAELTNAVVVLGSATPDVDTYYKTKNNEYKLLELPQRVTPGSTLPQVEVVDMREELKAGSRGLFSRSLTQAINNTIANGEQVILFLNRRGGSYYIQCRRCGFVLRCRRCEVPLSHHINDDILTCHQCNYKMPVPDACPNCGNRQLKFLGAGTQKLEQEVKLTFPRARYLRWDSDVIAGKVSNEDILRQFRGGEADVLIGTQMVAKGLDIPSVTLVGVVNADTSLNLPDFRAGERTYQLLSHVAGRAGRGPAAGKVIIQTFSPENYAIQSVARHDYASFYEQEIAYRRQLNNPPFSQLVRLVFTHTNDAICQREAEKMQKALLRESDARGIAGISIIGPAPAFIHRLRGRYRWQLVIRGHNLSSFLAPVDFGHGWTVDVDPIGLIQ
jgi:primosomal protein N' (replication factor Y)